MREPLPLHLKDEVLLLALLLPPVVLLAEALLRSCASMRARF